MEIKVSSKCWRPRAVLMLWYVVGRLDHRLLTLPNVEVPRQRLMSGGAAVTVRKNWR
jgi:hypothetical protein